MARKFKYINKNVNFWRENSNIFQLIFNLCAKIQTNKINIGFICQMRLFGGFSNTVTLSIVSESFVRRIQKKVWWLDAFRLVASRQFSQGIFLLIFEVKLELASFVIISEQSSLLWAYKNQGGGVFWSCNLGKKNPA